MEARTPASPLHRGFTLWIRVALLLLGVAASVITIIQFRKVAWGLGADEIPLGYWTDAGLWMSVALTVVALALGSYFMVTA